MRYRNSTDWNMVKLAFWMFFCGKYTRSVPLSFSSPLPSPDFHRLLIFLRLSVGGFLKTWVPFLLVLTVILVLSFVF